MSSITTSRDPARTIRLTRVRARLLDAQDGHLARNVSLLSMRVALAWIFMYHGAGKLFDFKHQGGIAGTTAFFQFQGLPAPHLMAYLVGLTEFGGGLLLLIGFAVPLAALALALDMIVAMVTTTLGHLVPALSDLQHERRRRSRRGHGGLEQDRDHRGRGASHGPRSLSPGRS